MWQTYFINIVVVLKIDLGVRVCNTQFYRKGHFSSSCINVSDIATIASLEEADGYFEVYLFAFVLKFCYSYTCETTTLSIRKILYTV